MILKCVNTKDLGRGLFKRHAGREVDGLTYAASYEAFAIPILDAADAALDGSPIIRARDIQFLIFDDNFAWNVYSKHHFAPASVCSD